MFKAAKCTALGAALVAALAAPNLGHATTYMCSFQDLGRLNVIPAKVEVVLGQDGTSAKVDHSMAQRHKGGPVAAQFVRDRADMLQVRWRLNGVVNSNGQKADLKFSLNYRKTDKSAWITFRAVGFDNTDQGTGTCARG